MRIFKINFVLILLFSLFPGVLLCWWLGTVLLLWTLWYVDTSPWSLCFIQQSRSDWLVWRLPASLLPFSALLRAGDAF